ncbi:N-6 DNA methylase, partial [Terrisporobacter hibernicus]
MDNYELAKSYEESLSLYDKKVNGIYYTPKIIVSYILQEVFKNHNIIKNPEPKILDLSCGCGNFLIEAYNMIYKLIKNNIDEINEAYGENYINNISDHIINKCIYG